MTMYEQQMAARDRASSIRIGESKFDGGLAGWIGYSILAVLGTALSLGIAYPWMLCMLTRWETRHTIIDGHRLKFDGTGAQLIGKWIVWLLLCIVTLGIYSFWLAIRVKQWKIKHTSMEA